VTDGRTLFRNRRIGERNNETKIESVRKRKREKEEEEEEEEE
jgi:hypothetical protein